MEFRGWARTKPGQGPRICQWGPSRGRGERGRALSSHRRPVQVEHERSGVTLRALQKQQRSTVKHRECDSAKPPASGTLKVVRTYTRACVPGEAARMHGGGGRTGECVPRARTGRTARAASGMALGWVGKEKETFDGSVVVPPAASKRGPLALELELLEDIDPEVGCM